MDAAFEIDALALSVSKSHLQNPIEKISSSGAPRIHLADLRKIAAVAGRLISTASRNQSCVLRILPSGLDSLDRQRGKSVTPI
jgi:hypothetical protein